jgi:hypothetical protein
LKTLWVRNSELRDSDAFHEVAAAALKSISATPNTPPME